MRVLTVMVIGCLAGCAAPPPPRGLTGADPQRGLDLMRREGCGACHSIPGLDWPRGRAGGTLDGFAAKPLIGGRVPNQPALLVRWISDAPSLSPAVGMPAYDLTEAEARDIAAYLYTLDDR